MTQILRAQDEDGEVVESNNSYYRGLLRGLAATSEELLV